MKLLWSEARKATAAATSSVVPCRPNGTVARNVALTASVFSSP
jgi:hypothetical protein